MIQSTSQTSRTAMLRGGTCREPATVAPYRTAS
jgi:hypothetical protein